MVGRVDTPLTLDQFASRLKTVAPDQNAKVPFARLFTEFCSEWWSEDSFLLKPTKNYSLYVIQGRFESGQVRYELKLYWVYPLIQLLCTLFIFAPLLVLFGIGGVVLVAGGEQPLNDYKSVLFWLWLLPVVLQVVSIYSKFRHKAGFLDEALELIQSAAMTETLASFKPPRAEATPNGWRLSTPLTASDFLQNLRDEGQQKANSGFLRRPWSVEDTGQAFAVSRPAQGEGDHGMKASGEIRASTDGGINIDFRLLVPGHLSAWDFAKSLAIGIGVIALTTAGDWNSSLTLGSIFGVGVFCIDSMGASTQRRVASRQLVNFMEKCSRPDYQKLNPALELST